MPGGKPIHEDKPVHIVGAGLAGLSAAMELAESGRKVTLHEAAAFAGGRCRSWHDRRLDAVIDNGSHMLLGLNRAVHGWLAALGTRDTLVTRRPAAFPFVDLGDGVRWRLRPNRGPLPWWSLVPDRRIPDTRWIDYVRDLAALLRADAAATVADCVDLASPLGRRLWAPLATAILNTPPEAAAARLLRPILLPMIRRGEAAWRPSLLTTGLSQAFVDPALARLRGLGVEVRFRRRLAALDRDDHLVRELRFADGERIATAGSAVLLALPARDAGALAPDIDPPRATHAIVNGHFRLPEGARLPEPGFLGIVGGMAQWLFWRDGVVSATVSAADALLDRPRDSLATALWSDAARALDLPPTLPPAWRILKERNATVAQTPENLARRNGPATKLANLSLAGDWTDPVLPATIEAALTSGSRAAARIAREKP
ncbi:MAG: hydroxysqualene dehydroxylase HpnE [Alphaproteobacteria bacterium]